MTNKLWPHAGPPVDPAHILALFTRGLMAREKGVAEGKLSACLGVPRDAVVSAIKCKPVTNAEHLAVLLDANGLSAHPIGTALMVACRDHVRGVA